MMIPRKLFVATVFLVYCIHSTYSCISCKSNKTTNVTINSIPISTREYWMGRANKLLSEVDSPCPMYPFAAVIVNHTLPNGLGKLVCSGVNRIGTTGDPTHHGEMVAISNCTAILTDKNGRYRLSPGDALDALTYLSLYTNAESCPMCAAAIRWSGFKEYIYGTSIETLIEVGWSQIRITSHNLFSASGDLEPSTKYIPNVLSKETDPYFMWQYNRRYPCPVGCRRSAGGDEACEAY